MAPHDTLPPHAARVLGHLAHLIDAAVPAPGAANDAQALAVRTLGCEPIDLATTSTRATGLDAQLLALALAADLEAHPPAVLAGRRLDRPPRWETIQLRGRPLRFPVELTAAFPAGTAAGADLVVTVADADDDDTHDGQGGLRLSAWSRTAEAGAAEAYLADLRARGRTTANPFRGQVVEARWMGHLGLALDGAELPDTKRADLVLPERVWVELDRNVHALYANLDRLAAAGLDTTRGILLAGPPGTGKTAACRVVANEVGDAVTVVFARADVVQFGVDALYAHAGALAPALVVLEDVDLVVGHRHGGGGGPALQQFLVALDGALSTGTGVVTLATTNDPSAIDPAARRSSRFDRVVDVPRPDLTGRQAILGRYLAGIDDGGAGVDARRVAGATEGWTGADLRALVGEAVLHADGGPLTTALLLGLVRDRGDDRHSGLYL